MSGGTTQDASALARLSHDYRDRSTAASMAAFTSADEMRRILATAAETRAASVLEIRWKMEILYDYTSNRTAPTDQGLGIICSLLDDLDLILGVIEP